MSEVTQLVRALRQVEAPVPVKKPTGPGYIRAGDMYQALLQDIQSVATVRSDNARRELTWLKYEIGLAILQSPLYAKWGLPELMPRLSQDLGWGERELYYVVQFTRTVVADANGNVDQWVHTYLPADQPVSWSLIKRSLPKVLEEGKAKPLNIPDPEDKPPHPRMNKQKAIAYLESKLGQVFRESDFHTVRRMLGIKLK